MFQFGACHLAIGVNLVECLVGNITPAAFRFGIGHKHGLARQYVVGVVGKRETGIERSGHRAYPILLHPRPNGRAHHVCLALFALENRSVIADKRQDGGDGLGYAQLAQGIGFVAVVYGNLQARRTAHHADALVRLRPQELRHALIAELRHK